MKPDTRKSAEGRASADAPAPDLTAQLAAIEEQERAIAQQKAQVRRAIWDDSIARLKGLVQQLVAAGHDPAQIGKALGLHTRPVVTSASSNKGPTTHAGWFQVYRSRAIQAYVKTHPNVAAALKSQKVSPSDYPVHIPADDLQQIDAGARLKADAKCPATPLSA